MAHKQQAKSHFAEARQTEEIAHLSTLVIHCRFVFNETRRTVARYGSLGFDLTPLRAGSPAAGG
jgi:hypothetical protein